MQTRYSFDYIRVKDDGSLPWLEIEDITGFIKLIENLDIKCMFQRGTSEDDSEGHFFFFIHNNLIYKLRGNHFSSLEDYYEAVSKGFNSASDFYEARNRGFNTFAEFDQVRRIGIDKKEDYLVAQKTGFVKGFEEFRSKLSKYKANKHTSSIPEDISNAVELMSFADSKGFKSYKEFEKAYDSGYPNSLVYGEAMRSGFKAADDFFEAARMGFSLLEEYELAKTKGIVSKQEFEEYKRLKPSGTQESACDEMHFLEFLQEFKNGEKFTVPKLKELFEKFQEKVKRQLCEEDIKVFPLWYSRKLETPEQLRKFISANEHVHDLGFYDETKDNFEVYIKSRAKIYVDGSNVALFFVSKSGEQGKYKNIIRLVEEVKKKDFSEIIIVSDASLKYRVDDPELLDPLKAISQYYEVPAHTTADEFLITSAKKEKCHIVTNDEFLDWKKKDKWIADNIGKLKMHFMILKDKVVIPGLEIRNN